MVLPNYISVGSCIASGVPTQILSLIISKFAIQETDKHLDWRLNYTGVEPRTLVTGLFVLLTDFSLMEKVLFNDCSQVTFEI